MTASPASRADPEFSAGSRRQNGFLRPGGGTQHAAPRGFTRTGAGYASAVGSVPAHSSLTVPAS